MRFDLNDPNPIEAYENTSCIQIVSNTIAVLDEYSFSASYILIELIYYLTYFSTIVPSKSCMFVSSRPFLVNATFSKGLVGAENVVLTTKGLQERNIHLFDGTTVEK